MTRNAPSCDIRMFKKPTDRPSGQILSTPADEQIDVRGLVRLGTWGAAATGALLFAVMAIQSENGARRVAGTSNAASDRSTRDARAGNRRRYKAADRIPFAHCRPIAIACSPASPYWNAISKTSPARSAASAARRMRRATSPLPPVQLPQRTVRDAPRSRRRKRSRRFPPTASRADIRPRAAPRRRRIRSPTITDFGVDIGGGPTIESLRDLWISAKGTHGSIFDGLRPVISVRDGKPGTAELRLVVGPLSNAAAAAKICASLSASGWTCRPAVFDGQRLALR